MSYSAFVYRPYYYYFEDEPYYEETYLRPVQYRKRATVNANPTRLTMKDGTKIEAFEGGTNWPLVILILVLLVVCYKNL